MRLLLITLLLAGTAFPEEQELDVVRALGLPPMVVSHVLKRVKNGAPLAVDVVLKDADRQPAKTQTLTLRWGEKSKEIVTDKDGKASFELTQEMLPRPILLVPKGLRARITTPSFKVSVGTGVRMGGPGAKPMKSETLDLDALDRIEVAGLEVYHPKGEEAAAREAMVYLARARGFVSGLVGLELSAPFGLALHDKGMVSLDVHGQVVFPVSLAAWKGKDQGPFGGMHMVRWVQIHEWVEGTVVGPGLYTNDQGTRFIGDGLAELMGYEYCRRYHRAEVRARLQQYIQRADALLGSGHHKYDLPKSFRARVAFRVGNNPGEEKDWGNWRPSPVEAAGYPMSFYFWHDLLEKAGYDGLRKVIAWMMQPNNPNLTAAGVLAEIERVTRLKPPTVIEVSRARERFEKLLKEVSAK